MSMGYFPVIGGKESKFMTMDIFSAIADPTRRNIVEMLASNEHLSATEISENFHISNQAISQHLKILREANVVNMEKSSQKRIYRLNTMAMAEVDQWSKNIEQRWSRRLDALDNVLAAEMKKLKNQIEKDDSK
jgi:DNA-binding transcriptional ArsR family regulator